MAMENWYMLTLVGSDRPGITAAVTQALFDNGMNLGEASMLRLGGNFTMMLMVSGADSVQAVERALAEVVAELGLKAHVDAIDGKLHEHIEPNLHVTVSGADRAGIVARVTGRLAEAGLNILDLSSDVAGSGDRPVYIMQIEGVADADAETLQAAVADLAGEGVEVSIQPLQTLLG
jgi:glycine cleavage system transcriptional repressor